MLVGPEQPAKRVWLLATPLCVAAFLSFSTLVHPCSARDYLNPPIGEGRAPARPLNPLVAVPTTTGTGAESTTVCVLDVLDQRHQQDGKVGVKIVSMNLGHVGRDGVVGAAQFHDELEIVVRVSE